MGEFNDGKKLIKYAFEFKGKGNFEITVVQPGALETALYLGAHMDPGSAIIPAPLWPPQPR